MKNSLLILSSVHLVLASAEGASVLVSDNGAPSNSSAATSLTLPSGTGTDWGYFNQTGTPSPASSTYNANNTSSDGSRTFTVTTINGGNVRGPGTPSTGSPFSFFDFTNGSPTLSGTDVRPTGVFNTQLGNTGATANAGLSLTLGNFATASQIQLWTFGFQSVGTFQVFLNGTGPAIYSTSVTTGVPSNGKTANLFTIDFTPDSTSDFLEIRYFLTSAAADTANAHVGFQAVSVSPIPEASSFALLGLAAGSLALRRRRR